MSGPFRSRMARLVFRIMGLPVAKRMLNTMWPIRGLVREVDPERDLDSLALFGHTFDRNGIDEYRESLRRELSAWDTGRNLLLVAVLGGAADEKVAAFIRLTRRDGQWWIMGLEVRPQYWRRGLAELLCRGAIERLRGMGGTGVHLSVKERNTPAVRLYVKLGFRDEPFPGDPLVGPDDRGMRLDFADLKQCPD